MSGLSCWNCGQALTELVLPVSRRADCPACRAELHVCRMCRFFAPDRPEQCTEDRAEPPTNKEVANVCEWFEPLGGLSGVARPEDRARAGLEALFGGGEGDSEEPDAADGAADAEDPAAAAKRRLDDLFS